MGPLQGKVIEDSFPRDQNSKMRRAGRLREGAGPRQATTSPSGSQEIFSTHTCVEKLLGGQRGVMLTNARLPIGLSGRIHLG